MTKRYDKDYWLRMADRYFEAETSDSEELLLKRFLASEKGQDEAFDEVRAVMGVFAMKKAAVSDSGQTESSNTKALAASPRKNRTMVWIYTGVAAAVVVILFVLTPMLLKPKTYDICVAYVDGHEITDRHEVLAMMHSSWDEVGYSESPSVESELEDLFSTLP